MNEGGDDDVDNDLVLRLWYKNEYSENHEYIHNKIWTELIFSEKTKMFLSKVKLALSECLFRLVIVWIQWQEIEFKWVKPIDEHNRTICVAYSKPSWQTSNYFYTVIWYVFACV